MEARPGGGKPAWIDGIRIRHLSRALASADPVPIRDDSVHRLSPWEVYVAPLKQAKSGSANDLLVWFNGRQLAKVSRSAYIWSDHISNRAHKAASFAIEPMVGENEIVILVRGGRFAGGGLFVGLGSKVNDSDTLNASSPSI